MFGGIETKKSPFLILLFSLFLIPSVSVGKDLPKIAVWDLSARGTPATQAQELTSFIISEITKLKKYEVYGQENVRTLAGWTAERMQLGCTDTKCLTALGQMDIAKLISGSVGKIGKRHTVSLNLFDTQNTRSENAISKTCESEDELIELIQGSVRELLGESPVAQVATKADTPAFPIKAAPNEYRDPVTGISSSLSTTKEIGRDGRFIAYDNGTVIDMQTGLMWAAKDNGADIEWTDAKRYCENYRGGGYTDWRIPTQDELAGLYDKSKSRLSACSDFFKIHVATELINITCFAPWASETLGSESGDFSFRSGGRSWSNPSLSGRQRALPVRTVK